MAETPTSRKLSVTRLGLGLVVFLGLLASMPFSTLTDAALATLTTGISTLVIAYQGGNVGEWFARRGK